jgi:hypothetical protein
MPLKLQQETVLTRGIFQSVRILRKFRRRDFQTFLYPLGAMVYYKIVTVVRDRPSLALVSGFWVQT